MSGHAPSDPVRESHDRLRDGMRELGYTVGRNPDGVDDSADAALVLIRGYRAKILGLRAVRAAAREVVGADRRGDLPGLEDAIDLLRAALEEENET